MKTYILHLVLDPVIIECTCAPDADILAIEREDMANNDEVYADEEDNGPCTCSVGSILAWERSDKLGSVGVLYTILVLILVNGRIMRDSTCSVLYSLLISTCPALNARRPMKPAETPQPRPQCHAPAKQLLDKHIPHGRHLPHAAPPTGLPRTTMHW